MALCPLPFGLVRQARHLSCDPWVFPQHPRACAASMTGPSQRESHVPHLALCPWLCLTQKRRKWWFSQERLVDAGLGGPFAVWDPGSCPLDALLVIASFPSLPCGPLWLVELPWSCLSVSVQEQAEEQAVPDVVHAPSCWGHGQS